MITIDSYLRVAKGEYVPVREAAPQLKTGRHGIEGAIELVIDGTVLLDQELWDDVDWLWAYLFNVAYDIRTKGSGQTYFPDQPIKIQGATARDGRVVLTVAVPDRPVRSAVIGERELMTALINRGTEFCDDLDSVRPDLATSVRRSLAQLLP